MNSDRKTNLDILRLFLALSVFHTHWHDLLAVPPSPLLLIPPVPCFVCLSGFLIPESFRQSRSPAHFWIKRALRIAPAFLMSLILVAVLFGPRAVWPTIMVYFSLALIPNIPCFDPVLWSLLLEEILYVFFVTLNVLKVWKKPVVWGCFIVSSTIWCILFTHMHVASVYERWWPNMQMGPITAFFAGNLLYVYKEKLTVRRILFGVPLVFLTILLPASVRQFLQPVYLTAFVAVVVAMLYTLPQVKLKFPDLSYGIYVYHCPIIIFLCNHHIARGELADGLWVMTVSAASWYLVEKPALALKNKIGRPRVPIRETPEKVAAG